MEGGSKRAILDDWTLDDVTSLRAHWRQYGPPVHIGLTHVAASLGVRLTEQEKAAPVSAPKPVVVDASMLADIPMPVAGGDTLAASLAILEKLKAMHGG